MPIYRPNYRLHTFTDVSPEFLKSIGKTTVLTDLDDTLAPRNVYTPNETVQAWVKKMTENAIRVFVVSNNHEKRVSDFATPLGIPFLFEAGKPRRKAILNAANNWGIDLKETVLLGDQLFTDMFLANRIPLTSILVDPCGRYGGIFVQIKRVLEIPIRKFYRYTGEML